MIAVLMFGNLYLKSLITDRQNKVYMEWTKESNEALRLDSIIEENRAIQIVRVYTEGGVFLRRRFINGSQ